MKRRDFLNYLGLGVLANYLLPKMAVAEATAAATAIRTVEVYDITLEGWSTLGSGYLGDDRVLKASEIVAYKPLEFPYTQDDHGHRFSLTLEDLSQILLDKDVSTLTTYALDHRHEVRVKRSRRDMESTPVSVDIDENGVPIIPV